jgi:hypothetical protein
VETGRYNSQEWTNLTKSSKEVYGSKRAVFAMMMMMMMMMIMNKQVTHLTSFIVFN